MSMYAQGYATIKEIQDRSREIKKDRYGVLMQKGDELYDKMISLISFYKIEGSRRVSEDGMTVYQDVELLGEGKKMNRFTVVYVKYPFGSYNGYCYIYQNKTF